MSEGNEIIDVEAVEVEETPNLPAVVTTEAWSRERMEYEAKPGRTAEGLSLDAAAVARHDAALAGNPERRCVAKTSKGGRCRKFAIFGSTVCKTHGGATAHVINKARIRAQMVGDRMMGKLIDFAFDDSKPPDVQLRAIRDALDRAGLKPPAEVMLSQGEPKGYEAVFDSIGGDPSVAGFPSVPSEEGISAGAYTSPAPAFPGYADEDQAEAGSDVPGEADEYGAQPAPTGSPRHPRARDGDRDRQPQPPSRHITGEAAMQVANWANRAMAESHGLPWGDSDRRRR